MSEKKVIAVALIDDNRLVREGLTSILNAIDDFDVVAAGSSVDQALLREVAPDVVLLDLGLPQGDSLRIAEQVKQEVPAAKIIVMDLLPMQEEIRAYVNAGVSGFIMKDATLEEFAATVRSVAGGANVLPPELTGTLFSQIAHDAMTTGRPLPLDAVRMTPREREVVALIAEGMSNKEIARQLNIATHTVKSHVRNIMEKLTLHTRLQIAAYAHGEGRA